MTSVALSLVCHLLSVVAEFADSSRPVAWEAVRLMKALNITPLRTVRVVGWCVRRSSRLSPLSFGSPSRVSEENGGAGADQYAKDHINETTVLAIESDEGINAPTGPVHSFFPLSLSLHLNLIIRRHLVCGH